MNMTPSLIAPAIHLNGTSKEALTTAFENASEKLEEAYQAIKDAAPNGRDYYVIGNDALQMAAVQHLDRLSRIDKVKQEIDWIIQEINK